MSNQAQGSQEDEELTEFMLDPADEEDGPDPSIPTQSQQSRGRPRIQEKWTRIINVGTADANRVKTYSVANDLLVSSGLPTEPSQRVLQPWTPVFCPKQFVKENSRIKVANYELPDERLK